MHSNCTFCLRHQWLCLLNFCCLQESNLFSNFKYIVRAAQDRREMLEEIMRRGTSSLGTDVPSEREINRLAARSDEEFWMFEKMDEERRQKENYRSRLMDELEVPEWAYSAPENDTKKIDVTGKRRRKEVVYADTLSDLQWMKAVENGEDMSKLSGKGKRRNHLPPESNVAAEEGEKVIELNENKPMMSEGTTEVTYGLTTPDAKRQKSEGANADKHDYHGWNGHLFTWNTHKKKKRSRFATQNSSPDSRGQNSNGKGNGWA